MLLAITANSLKSTPASVRAMPNWVFKYGPVCKASAKLMPAFCASIFATFRSSDTPTIASSTLSYIVWIAVLLAKAVLTSSGSLLNNWDVSILNGMSRNFCSCSS